MFRRQQFIVPQAIKSMSRRTGAPVTGIMFSRPQAVSMASFSTFSGPIGCGISCADLGCSASTSLTAKRAFSTSSIMRAPKNDALAGFSAPPTEYKEEEQQSWEDEQQERLYNEGYLPFPPPFHTVNIVGVLFIANIIFYLVMRFDNDDSHRDFLVEHFTLSHENYHKIYPFFTYAFYQENFLQLAIDCWLLWQFGNTMLGFLGGQRMMFFWALTSVGGGLLHVGRQFFELHYGHDPLEVRGRCFGPNPFILGLVGVEGLIFRNLNFIQQPPIPFVVLTAFVMVIDVWRIFTTKPEEHGAPTGGALVAYLFWRLPTRMLGLDKLTAAM